MFIPYEEAITLWRGGQIWEETPKNARPVWTDWFDGEDLPRTMKIDSRDSEGMQIVEEMDGASEFEVELSFDYQYDGFPKEINLFLESEFEENSPLARVTWITPDGREFESRQFSIGKERNFRFGNDSNIRDAFPGQSARKGLLRDPENEDEPLKGEYKVRISGYTFEEDSVVEAKNVLYGQVHGIAGTDHRRRELIVSLLWGTPVALMFGVLAAIGATVSTFIVAAIGVWYGGWLDSLVQRLTEINLVIPLLPVLIMVGMFFSNSLWVLLLVLILKGVFSSQIKTYRAMFLQAKNADFIEAAQAYGANDRRIIFFYLIPKIIPTLIPTFITAIPTYVFLEASLAVLGLGDPILPTWGKMLNDALNSGALYRGQFYWVLQPAVLLMMTGLGFALTGYALDRIFNPRLRRL
ncbi:MAG: ABC transporter permease [Bacillota bacterium]